MPRILKIIAVQWLFLLSVFLLTRIAFLFIYSDLFSEIGIGDILFSALHGFRFDLSVISVLFGLINLPLLIPIKIRHHPWYLSVIAVAGYFALIFLLSILVSDLGYYKVIGRRMSFEFFQLGNDIMSMVKLVLKEQKLSLIVGIIFLSFISYLWWKMWVFIVKIPTPRKDTRWYMGIPYFFVMLVLFVLAGRGGFQEKPITESHAFTNPKLVLGHFTLNAPFTVLRQFSQKQVTPYQWVNRQHAIQLSQDLLKTNEQHQNLSNGYPFYRKRTSNNKTPEKRKNIVLLILESWPAHSMGALGGNSKDTTPFFDQLSKKGRLYDRFVSNGTRSVEGMASILLSIPAFPDFALIMSSFEQNAMFNLPEQLYQKGYNTFFVHGNFHGSFGFHQFATKIGFKKVLASQDFEENEKTHDGTWGIWDHVQLERIVQEADQASEPFFASWFSSSSHEPYVVPSKKHEFFQHPVKDYAWLNTLRYSDWSLSHFFKIAESKPWFKNTLFIITADHTISGRANRTMDSARVPLLLYTPSGDIAAGVDHRPASQIDIIPTIIDYLDMEIDHASMGKSLLQSPDKAFGIFSSSTMTWFENTFAYQFSDKKLLGVYNVEEDWNFQQPIKQMTDQHKKAISHYQSWLQESHNAVVSNRIIPPFSN